MKLHSPSFFFIQWVENPSSCNGPVKLRVWMLNWMGVIHYNITILLAHLVKVLRAVQSRCSGDWVKLEDEMIEKGYYCATRLRLLTSSWIRDALWYSLSKSSASWACRLSFNTRLLASLSWSRNNLWNHTTMCRIK